MSWYYLKRKLNHVLSHFHRRGYTIMSAILVCLVLTPLFLTAHLLWDSAWWKEDHNELCIQGYTEGGSRTTAHQLYAGILPCWLILSHWPSTDSARPLSGGPCSDPPSANSWLHVTLKDPPALLKGWGCTQKPIKADCGFFFLSLFCICLELAETRFQHQGSWKHRKEWSLQLRVG